MCSFSDDAEAVSCKHKRHFSFRLVGIFYEIYNVQISDKYENVLKDMCWNDAYLILGLKDQYLIYRHNKATQTFSVAIHVGLIDMHTLYPWKFQMLFYTYDCHVA